MDQIDTQQLVTDSWTKPGGDILAAYGVTEDDGLTSSEVDRRLRIFGSNVLTQKKQHSLLEIAARQFKSLIVLLLAAAAIAAILFGEYLDSIAIIAVIVINAAIGFVTELRAVRSMEALEKLNEVAGRAIRNGEIRNLNATELVPGDIVLLEGGDLVTADCRLITASKLQANEAALTGESLPVEKSTQSVKESTVLAERSCMVWKGTEIVRGSATAVVVATGMKTEIGEVTALVSETEDEKTPLEADLDRLGNRLILVVIVVALVIIGSGLAAGRELFLMVETAIALAVAAIPEGLPIVATIALARGMMRMAKKNALMRHLAAVETLGSTSVICTDKTGTLTIGSMDANQIETWEGSEAIDATPSESARRILTVGALCNNASLGGSSDPSHPGSGDTSGDPIEVALLDAALRVGIDRSVLVESTPEIGEEAFDADVKMMATYHRRDDELYVAVKGAPERVIASSTHFLTAGGKKPLDDDSIAEWKRRNDRHAGSGLRLLACAEKTYLYSETPGATSGGSAAFATTDYEPYSDLTLIGFVIFRDPPREEAKHAIAACRSAGVRVVMITGDQAATASAIADEVELIDGDRRAIAGSDWDGTDNLDESRRREILRTQVFSRFSPRQKMDLIDLHQKNGAVVAMTGDGVNDAPALKKADIGVAMGIRGTQVAREAADIVLKDDSFSTIVEAVREGRVIFRNIRSFVTYLLTCNLSEILLVTTASFLAIPLPILPLQILFLNLVTDLFPALALGIGEGDNRVMESRVRPKGDPIVDRKRWFEISGFATTMAISVLASLLIAIRVLGLPSESAVTISFLTLALTQLWHVFSMRPRGARLFRNEITKNPFIWGALILCIGLLLVALYVPTISAVLELEAPGIEGWSVAVGMSLAPFFVGSIRDVFRR